MTDNRKRHLITPEQEGDEFLSKTQKELIHTLKEFEMPEETVIGILLTIDTDNQAVDLMEWLVKNPYATHAEILDQVDIINPNPKNVEDKPTKKKVIWNGTQLLGLHSEKVLSYEQLERACQIIKRERQKYSTREEQDKMADKKCLELVTALRACKTEKDKEDILVS